MGVSGDETHSAVTYGEDKCETPRDVGFAQGEISQFALYELFFYYQWIIPVALFSFVRGDSVASHMTDVLVIPIENS